MVGGPPPGCRVLGLRDTLPRGERWDEAAGRHRAWWPKPHSGARGRVPQRWRPAMEHLGIDVHKVESQICILTESGEVVERRIRTQRERFAAVLGERPRAKVLIEASTESEWVARCLEELGHEVVVADPNFAAMYATQSRKVKTGLRVAWWCAASFVRRVAKLVLPGQLKSEIAPLLAVFVSVDRQLVWIDTRLEHLARTDETVERLCTAPSVGPVTAAAFSSTVDDPRRFKSAHQVEAYLGLTPSEWSSGEKQSKGHITKAGNTRMRKLLVQVAVSILRLRSPRTEALRKWATGIAVRRGKKIAIVAWRGGSLECSLR